MDKDAEQTIGDQQMNESIVVPPTEVHAAEEAAPQQTDILYFSADAAGVPESVVLPAPIILVVELKCLAYQLTAEIKKVTEVTKSAGHRQRTYADK